MHFVVSLVVIGAVTALWVSLCLRLVAWQNSRTEASPARAARTRVPRPRTRLVLPEGHRPPPGLSPLSPSERFLTQEAHRGIRELQLFLVDQLA